MNKLFSVIIGTLIGLVIAGPIASYRTAFHLATLITQPQPGYCTLMVSEFNTFQKISAWAVYPTCLIILSKKQENMQRVGKKEYAPKGVY